NVTPATSPNVDPAILTAGPDGTAQEGEGYLRLTNNGTQRNGYAYNINTFSSANGLDISFEYYIHSPGAADGIVFFLFDASVKDRMAMPVLGYSNPGFTAGAYGGALSYTQRGANEMPGLSKGFVAIAFDE